eukprot:3030822-Rhodomonas_salina.4
MEPVSNTNVVAAIEEARAWDQGVDARAELESKYMRKCASPACGAFGARLRCSRCKEAVYCSSDCQPGTPGTDRCVQRWAETSLEDPPTGVPRANP